MVLGLFNFVYSINRISSTQHEETKPEDSSSKGKLGKPKIETIDNSSLDTHGNLSENKSIIPFHDTQLNPFFPSTDNTLYSLCADKNIEKVEDEQKTGEIYDENGNIGGRFLIQQRSYIIR